MHRPSLSVLASAVLALAGAACTDRGYPGAEEIGTFEFTATVPGVGDCNFDEMPRESFTFRGIFSRNPDGTTFFTINEHDRGATFDGQIAATQETAARRFEACACPDDTDVTETLTVALLSRSQRDAYREANPGGTDCPPNALEGGIPPVGTPYSEGRVVEGPGTRDGSFDAVVACGVLEDSLVVGAETCECAACTNRYRVDGVRR